MLVLKLGVKETFISLSTISLSNSSGFAFHVLGRCVLILNGMSPTLISWLKISSKLFKLLRVLRFEISSQYVSLARLVYDLKNLRCDLIYMKECSSEPLTTRHSSDLRCVDYWVK